MLYTLNLYSAVCLMYRNKTEKKKNKKTKTRQQQKKTQEWNKIKSNDRWEGGSGWGIHVNPWLIHVTV